MKDFLLVRAEELLEELCEFVFDIDDLGNYSHPGNEYLDKLAQEINEYFDTPIPSNPQPKKDE